MKRVKRFHVTVVAVASLLALLTCASTSLAQSLTGGQTRAMRQQPFSSIYAPMPKAVTRGVTSSGRASVPVQTVDLTDGSLLSRDRNPYWSKNESTVVFQSDRGDIKGTTVATDKRTHIYAMGTGGGSLVAITGPLASPVVSDTKSQTYPAFNESQNAVVYVETDGTGAVDIIEQSLSTGTTTSLLAASKTFTFDAVQHPRYAPNYLGGVVFAGRIKGEANFHIYTVDPLTKVIVQVTSGAADDRNPAVSFDGSMIAFDSNRADITSQTRDIWAIGHDTSIAPVRVTNFPGSDNVEPSWSSGKTDKYSLIDATQIVFASTRVDSKGDGNADSVDPKGTHDIYRVRVRFGPDPANAASVTLTEVESASGNPAYKHDTSDADHIYDDRNPGLPQQSAAYRAIYETDRTMYDPSLPSDHSQSGPAGQPQDIFSSVIVDVDAPSLLRYSDETGEVVHVEPRLALPGRPVTISVKVADFQSGIRDVWVQIKNPNSATQGADGVEHKVYSWNLLFPSKTQSVNVPLEYEAEPVDAKTGTYPNHQGVGGVAPEYFAGWDDATVLSGVGKPDKTSTRWLQLTSAVRDEKTGYWTYSADWTTPNSPSDYIIDVIAFDRASNPNGGAPNSGANWRIYDNVWGFSTMPFVPQQSILFVSDYACGQKFFGTRFGQASQLQAGIFSYWGSESWFLDGDERLLPTKVNEDTKGVLDLTNVLFGLGQNSYGVKDPLHGRWRDTTVLDSRGSRYPVTQRYDLWRILCRGGVPDSVLRQYLPSRITQPAETTDGTPRSILVSRGCVIWDAPYSGDVFAGPGSIVDPAAQAQLSAYLAAGGRLFISGQDIAWALTLNGTQTNSFITNDLKATFVADAIQHEFLDTGWIVVPFFSPRSPKPLYASNTYGSASILSAGAGGSSNPIVGDPYFPSWSASWTPGHVYGQFDATKYDDDMPFNDNSMVAGKKGSPSTFDEPRTYGNNGIAFTDLVTPGADTTVDLTYGGTSNPALYHFPSVETESAMSSTDEPLNGRRVVYSPMGLDALNPQVMGAPPDPAAWRGLKNRRAEILHNIVCWFRTGTIRGSVLDTEAGAPIIGALVRAYNNAGKLMYTAISDKDGRYQMEGVRPGGYSVTAAKAGWAVQRKILARVHGLTVAVTTDQYMDALATTGDVSFRMLRAEAAQVSGTVYRADGKTPVEGATLTLVDRRDASNTMTVNSDSKGAYSFGRVLAGTVYVLTCSGTGFGDSTPASYPVPNINDPIVSQRDAEVMSSKSYIGFDFNLKALPGSATGQVVVDPSGTGIGGATVVATLGAATVTAVADASGNFTFSPTSSTPNGLDAGTWSLVASAPGYVPNTPQAVVVVASTTTSGIVIKLLPAPPGSLSGLVTRTSDNSPQAGVTVTVLDQNGAAIVGVSPVVTGDVHTSGSYRYNYSFASVPAGSTVKVTAVKSGYKPKSGSVYPQSALIESGKETQGVNFQLDAMYTFPRGTTMVSAPYDYSSSDIATVLDVPVANRGSLGFFWWDPTAEQYASYPNSAQTRTFVPGVGYFLRYGLPLPVTTAGGAVSRTATFSIPLKSGWNLVGNPFSPDDSGAGINIDWTRVNVVVNGATIAHDQAVAQGIVGAGIYTYILDSPILDFRVDTWKGYFVRAYRDCTLVLDPVNGAWGRAAATRAIDSRVLQGRSGWALNLQARSGDVSDTTNYVGVADGATDGFDGFKVEKAPAFGTRYVRVGLNHADWGIRSGEYGVDVRSNTPAPRTWDVSVSSAVEQGSVTLSWPGASRVGKAWTVTLTDLATGTVRNLRSSSSYTWQSTGSAEVRKFRLAAVPATRSAELVISRVTARQVRSVGLNVSYNLSSAADVELRVLGSRGELVRSLAAQTGRAAGVSQATWDGKNARGIVVPAGMYQVEIRAKSVDGSQSVRHIAPVVITR